LKGVVAGLLQSTALRERQAEADRQQNKERFERIEAQAESDRQEIREAIENLIISNEVTRDLAQKVAALQVQMSMRVTDIDKRVTDLEAR
jgi:uncharacterized protein YhaN